MVDGTRRQPSDLLPVVNLNTVTVEQRPWLEVQQSPEHLPAHRRRFCQLSVFQPRTRPHSDRSHDDPHRQGLGSRRCHQYYPHHHDPRRVSRIQRRYLCRRRCNPYPAARRGRGRRISCLNASRPRSNARSPERMLARQCPHGATTSELHHTAQRPPIRKTTLPFRLRTGTRACRKSSDATCSACSSTGRAITHPSTSIGILLKPNHRPSISRSPQARRSPWDSSLAQIDPKHRQRVSQTGAHIGRRLNRHASCV